MKPSEPGGRLPEDLLDDRVASPGAAYFLTLLTKDRQPWLEIPRTRGVVMAVLRSWHMERNGRILAVNVMPDRVHALIEPGKSSQVTQIIAGWKAATRRGAGYAETFERDFHGHRLRETENAEDYGLYMFLAPYRSQVLKVDQAWPGWWLPDPVVFQFPSALSTEGLPPAAWLEWPEARFAGLTLVE